MGTGRTSTTKAGSSDEALMHCQSLAGVPVMTGRSRYRSGMKAIKQFPVDVFVLDDGFQHASLKKDMSIVTIDATRPPDRLAAEIAAAWQRELDPRGPPIAVPVRSAPSR